MELKKLNNEILGIFLGLLAPILGVYAYYKIAGFYYMAFRTFLEKAYTLGVTAKVMSLGVLANLVIFLIFINLDSERIARGILIATFVYAIIILAVKFIV